MTDVSEGIDLDELERLAKEATPGPWERGDHWHIQGSDFCQCSEWHGPLVEERQMNINGTMMDAHVHRSEKPWWEHGIYSEVRQGGFPVNVVNDTQEYGLMADTDAEFIAAANPSTVLALLARLRKAEARIEKASKGAELIAVERERQVTEEGYYADHDRGHEHQLARAACSYVESADALLIDDKWMIGMLNVCSPRSWPWAEDYWKPTGDPVRDLTKAGALIAAAIDSLEADTEATDD